MRQPGKSWEDQETYQGLSRQRKGGIGRRRVVVVLAVSGDLNVDMGLVSTADLMTPPHESRSRLMEIFIGTISLRRCPWLVHTARVEACDMANNRHTYGDSWVAGHFEGGRPRREEVIVG
jgi:hypothetical protein